METYIELIKKRRSVRTYDEKTVSEEAMKELLTLAENIENPYGLPVSFKLLSAKKDNLSCPVVVGTDLYIGGRIKNEKYCNEAFGFSFELMILYALSLDLGTVWLGGTMNREEYEKAMNLKEDELMPCASALGYFTDKMSVREVLMRKAIKANERNAFEALFFYGDFNTALTKEKAGKLLTPLEMVRLAPSAVNKQPWRVVVCENKAHFYLVRNKEVTQGKALDMQKIDMGIALCHFAVASKETGLDISFEINEPNIEKPKGAEYIATYAFC